MAALPYRLDTYFCGGTNSTQAGKKATTTEQNVSLLTSIPKPRYDAKNDELRKGVQHEEAPSHLAQVGRPYEGRLSRFSWSNGGHHEHCESKKTAAGSEYLEANGSLVWRQQQQTTTTTTTTTTMTRSCQKENAVHGE